MTARKISLACSLYDRILPLYMGEVEVEGFDVDYHGGHGATHVRKLFDQMGAVGGLDVAEMSSSEFIAGRAAGDRRYVAIPVFPSRAFRSNCIFVNRTRVRSPADLNGKRIGVPLYTMTAAVFARGFLSDEYGVNPYSIDWIEGSMFEGGKYGNPSSPAMVRSVSIRQNAEPGSLSQLLAQGDIDATIGPFIPDTYGKSPDVVRLFPEYRKIERDYFSRSGVFPIMHVVVIARDTHERYPQLAQALFDAFTASKNLALARMKDVASLEYMLPWLGHDVEEIDAVFGGDPWPYGLTANRPTLTTLCRYLWEQGLTEQNVAPEDVFLSVAESSS